MPFETLKTLCRFAGLLLKEVARSGQETSLNSAQGYESKEQDLCTVIHPGTSIMQSGITLHRCVTHQGAAETTISSGMVLFEAY